MLLAGWLRVRVPMRSMNLFNLPNPSGRTRPWGFTQPPIERSIINSRKCFWGVEHGRSVRLTTSQPSVIRLSRKCGILHIEQPHESLRPFAGIALL
jgi:hypothetical protein